MEGYGTDAYLHLKKVADPNPNPNPNHNPNLNLNLNLNFNLDMNFNPKGVGFERTPSMIND